jgi:hypothetical protein
MLFFTCLSITLTTKPKVSIISFSKKGKKIANLYFLKVRERWKTPGQIWALSADEL